MSTGRRLRHISTGDIYTVIKIEEMKVGGNTYTYWTLKGPKGELACGYADQLSGFEVIDG